MQHLYGAVFRCTPEISPGQRIIIMSIVNGYTAKSITTLSFIAVLSARYIVVTISNLFKFKGNRGSRCTDRKRCAVLNIIASTNFDHPRRTLASNFDTCEFSMIQRVVLDQDSGSKTSQNAVILFREIQHGTRMTHSNGWSLLAQASRSGMSRHRLSLTRLDPNSDPTHIRDDIVLNQNDTLLTLVIAVTRTIMQDGR